MALSVGYSRYGGTSSRRQQAFRRQALCQFESPARAVLRRRRAGPPGAAHTVLPQMASPPGKLGGVVEIEMSGARIRVEPGVELATLSTVLSALRGIR